MMLNTGLYERVVDRKLRGLLESLDSELVVQEVLDGGDSHSVLTQYMGEVLARALAGASGEDRVGQQIALCNRVIALLAEHNPVAVEEGEHIDAAGRRLLEVINGLPLTPPRPSARPETPLSVSCLLTGTRIDPSLVSQLKREILTADRVDILCSFIKWSGVRILEEELHRFTDRPGSQLRVITTSYMGATDLKAVEFLRALPNTRLKLSYDTRRTRLHAKAYLFYRQTGFGTAYVGSANLSNAALTDGLEWNVKVSQYESAHLWEKVHATFDTYWNDSEFTPYEAEQTERLRTALALERAGGGGDGFYQFDLYPYPFQQEILDKLDAERVLHQRSRNLVVAATGTGKTVVAAFDYKRCRQQWLRDGRPARLLFVAHREEILKQSLACFRAVLRDQNFGDLLVGTHEPASTDHLFVSIQSFNARKLWEDVPPHHYDYVVVDEFHHAEASSYQRLLGHLQPRQLLGLTATPERSDGGDVRRFFDDHVSAEIRLPTAINRKLLCPFQYFAITDSVNLAGLTWQRGGYQAAELDRQYTGNDERAELVVRSVHEKLLDVRQARGLGFCVSIQHAEYMAAFFRRAGVPAAALSANSTTDERGTVQRRLREREINFIFVVDLYNEGVDIPEVDTVLFLRPTESLTVFLQQLGRGLRLSDGKDCLTVLDFIGQAHRNFNFEMRFRALMDHPKQRVDREIEDGCPHVPLGCAIQLERVAQSHVLDNISRALGSATANLVQRIGRFQSDTGSAPTLARFLDYYEMQADDLYRRDSWTKLCARAGLRPLPDDPDADMLTKGLRRLAHVNSPAQIGRLMTLLGADTPPAAEDTLAQRLLTMLHLSLWGPWQAAGLQESLARLRQNPAHRAELIELLQYRYDKVPLVPPELRLPYACPLEVYGSYTRDEILGAFGYWGLQNRPGQREGVLYLSDLSTDLFFVTLNKTEGHYSPTTMYEDYAVSERLFHWQSQSNTSENSPTGQRYIHHAQRGQTMLLFVREDRSQNGLAAPYQFLGPVTYQSHSGSRPMSILWRLASPIPAHLLPMTQRLAVA